MNLLEHYELLKTQEKELANYVKSITSAEELYQYLTITLYQENQILYNRCHKSIFKYLDLLYKERFLQSAQLPLTILNELNSKVQTLKERWEIYDEELSSL